MSGIYIHIPFCRQACHYCDFHFSTNLKKQDQLVDALCLELYKRKEYLNEPVKTLYFGGGTPSLLSANQLEKLISSVKSNFFLEDNAELTLEANPEDLDQNKTQTLLKLGINRLSIGVQTFDDKRLRWINRIHDKSQIINAFKNARRAGFKNISIDMMYALPGTEPRLWKEELTKAVNLGPEHISLYGLTIEKKTTFGKWEEKGKLIQLPEEEAATQYLTASEYLSHNGYVQYEVSNFGQPGFFSRHNMSYWNGSSYLGIGPGSHSYNGSTRQINVSNNVKFLSKIIEDEDYFEVENLSTTQLINEKILTGLRTRNGLNIAQIKDNYGVDLLVVYAKLINQLKDQNLLFLEKNNLRLTINGLLVADEIALRMFFTE